MRLITVIAVMLAPLALAGCGIKGPLQHPPQVAVDHNNKALPSALAHASQPASAYHV